MLKNYIKIALRNVRRHKVNSFINIFGLAIGLACSMLIFLFVRHEKSYDRFHEKADLIYRVTYEEVNTPAQRHLATVSPPMAAALVETYPEIVHAVRLRVPDPQLFSRGEQQFHESDFFFADSSFFDVFSFPLAQGNPETALAATHSIVLTPETARKYFGNENPMGQVVTMNHERDLTVTGVLEPIPSHTHLPFDFLISFTTFEVPPGYPVTLESWGWISFHTYVVLTEEADAAVVEAKLPDFMRTHFDEERARNVRLRLQPVTDIYLGQPKHPKIASGQVAYVYGLSGIAVLILLLACFNFMNLSTAHSMRRSKEVGVRKVLGASRSHLRRQFLGESVLIALLSLILALLLLDGLQEILNRVVGLEVALPPSDYPIMLLIFLGVALLVGMLGGSYPALVLSSFQPAGALKGQVPARLSGGTSRRTLIVLQFSIAIALIAGSIMVREQMKYVHSKELGFEKEQVIALHGPGLELLARYGALKEKLLQNPKVIRVTMNEKMFDGDQGSVPIYPEGSNDQEVYAMNIYNLHFDFLETLGIDVLEGRAPSEAFPSDSASAVMLNRTAAKIFAAAVPGWDAPIDKRVRVSNIMEGRIIGIVEDFHFASLHTEIGPLVLYFSRTPTDKVFLRVHPGNIPELLALLERDWKQIFPEHPFVFTFLDEYIHQLYLADQQFSRLVLVFSLLTIVIACLGLYGLVAFVTQLRTKEIGIRKVLGASVPGIIMLLSKRFLLYILVANLIAWPLAYFGVNQWLEGFAYRIDPGVGTFVLAGGLALLIALLTLSHQSIRAALADPVKALRYE